MLGSPAMNSNTIGTFKKRQSKFMGREDRWFLFPDTSLLWLIDSFQMCVCLYALLFYHKHNFYLGCNVDVSYTLHLFFLPKTDLFMSGEAILLLPAYSILFVPFKLQVLFFGFRASSTSAGIAWDLLPCGAKKTR